MSITVILAPFKGHSAERFNSDPPGKFMDRQNVFGFFDPLRVKISTLAPLCFMFYYIFYKLRKYKKFEIPPKNCIPLLSVP